MEKEILLNVYLQVSILTSVLTVLWYTDVSNHIPWSHGVEETFDGWMQLSVESQDDKS